MEKYSNHKIKPISNPPHPAKETQHPTQDTFHHSTFNSLIAKPKPKFALVGIIFPRDIARFIENPDWGYLSIKCWPLLQGKYTWTCWVKGLSV